MTLTPPWLAQLMNDTSVTDICINQSDAVFFDRGSGLEQATVHNCLFEPWDEAELKRWTIDTLSGVGKTWDARHPFMDAAIPPQHRLHVVFSPVARKGFLISLRRLNALSENFKSQISREEKWNRISARWEGKAVSELVGAIERHESIILSGATGSGKTTLANDLLTFVPDHERMIALEDTPELAPLHPHFISLVSRPPNADGFGEVTLRTLLKQTLRMRPDRIVLGECRGAEVLELLQSLNTGHGGALATLHANSPRDALKRIELLCLLSSQDGSNGSLPLTAIRDLLVNGIQWIAHVERMPVEGNLRLKKRRITQLCRLEGREGDTLLLRPVI